MRAPVASFSKKLLSIFFAAALTLGLMPIVALAEPTQEDTISGSFDGEIPVEFQDEVARSGSVAEPPESADGTSSRGDAAADLSIPAGTIINQKMPLDSVVAQAESTRTFFLAQTLESARGIPMVSAKLPIDKGGSVDGAELEQGDEDGAEEEGEGSDEPDLGSGVSSESTVVGSFTVDGLTYAIEPGGESVAVVAADYGKLPSDQASENILAIPSAVSADGVDGYSVNRIADGAFSGPTKDAAGASATREGTSGSFDEEATGLDPSVEGEGAEDAEELESSEGQESFIGIVALGIPASVSSIEDGAFSGSDTLQYLVVSDDNPTYATYDGALYSADLATLRLIPEGRVGAVRIAPSATDVDPEVFSHCPLVDAVVADADSAAFYSEDGCLYEKSTDELVWKSLADASIDGSLSLNEKYDELSSIVDDYFDRGVRNDVLLQTKMTERGVYAVSSGNCTWVANAPCWFIKRFYTADGKFQAESVQHSGHMIPNVSWATRYDTYISAENGNHNWDDMVTQTPAGYSFDGIFSDAAYRNPYPNKSKQTISSPTTFYHKFTPITYNISYWDNGGYLTGHRLTYNVESPSFTLAQPVRQGYTFAGWEVSGASGVGIANQGQPNATVQKGTIGNLSASARWTPNTYALSFDPNGGTGGQPGSVTATYDANMPAISTTAPVRLGYTFQGWYDTAASSGGTQYYAADGTSVRTWDKTSDATLYARWSLNSYSVTYEDRAGNALSGWTTEDGSALPSAFNEATSPDARALPSMVKRGYTWKGWLYEGSPVTFIPDVSKSITIVADFEADPYTIEVDLTGGAQTGWHEGAFENITYDDPILALPDNDANLKRPGYVFSHFVAHREGSDEEASVFGRDGTGAYTVPTARLLPGESYQVLNLGSGEDVYDVASIEAVWIARIALDVPASANLGILVDAATDTVRFRANETSYAGDATDVYAELPFTSYTTAPIGIVEVAEDTADAGHADRAALAQEVFGAKMGDVTITLSDEKAPGHALPLGGKTTLPSDESHLAGLVLDAAGSSPSKKTFYLGMGLSSLRASDVATDRSGDIAKLFYTVALLDGDDIATDPSRLEGYDGEGVVW